MERLLYRLFLIFLRVSNLTFGGGDPTMAALHAELVAARGWLSGEKYALIFALARITPGTNLLAFCAGAGWALSGWAGAVLSVLAATLPSAVVVLFLAVGYEAWKSNALAMAAIAGSLAAAVGMMATGAWQLLWPHLGSRRWWRTAIVFGASLLLSLKFSLSPIQVLALAAITGLLWRVPVEK
jgi:chromate transporter